MPPSQPPLFPDRPVIRGGDWSFAGQRKADEPQALQDELIELLAVVEAHRRHARRRRIPVAEVRALLLSRGYPAQAVEGFAARWKE